MRILVLGGGTSPERAVSLRSSEAVQRALEVMGHDVRFVDPADTDEAALRREAKAAEVVFPILHGAGGEDGSVQRLLDELHVPYLGSDAAACARTFDKVRFKRLLEDAGITTPAWDVWDEAAMARSPLAGRPFVLKPITGGSSIDTFIVRRPPGPRAAIDEALSRYGTMLAEALIEGREITVGVLGGTALPVVEIVPPEGAEFDYENKYNGATAELCPPQGVDAATQARAQELALQVHRLTGCRHVSRTDMLIDANGTLYVIDTNTIPGLTAQSLLPKAAAAAGLEWTELVQRFLELACPVRARL